MKNIKLIIAALASFAALSCEKESLPQNNSETIQETEMIPLILSSGESTKTHVLGNEIYWDLDDQIMVFSDKTRYDGPITKSNKTTFSIDNNSISGKFAKFTGNVPKGTKKIWAVYPAGNASSCETDGTKMKVTLPIVQNAIENTFDNNLNISVAKAEVSNTDSRNEFDPQTTSVPVNFENVCSFLKFTTPGTDNTQSADISKVILSSNTAIAGSLVIDPATPKVTSSSSTSITMSGSFKQNTEYWFVIAKSGDVLNGLSLTVVTESGDVYCWAISGQTTLKTGQYRSIGKISLNENHKITLSAQHTYDTSGYLTGTDVSVKCGTTVLTPSTYSIKKGGSEKRNQGTTNYPYLPKGTGYTYEGTVTWNQVNVAVPEMSFVVPAPDFSVVDFTPFTSYSKITIPSEANKFDGSGIFVPISAIKISPEILKNPNYTTSIKLNDNFACSVVDEAGATYIKATRSYSQWGQYNISKLTCTFDGVTKYFSKQTAVQLELTGIPFSFEFFNKNNANGNYQGWTADNIKWQAADTGGTSDAIQYKCAIFHGTNGVKVDGYLLSPNFYIPTKSSYTVDVEVTAHYYAGLTSFSGTIDLIISTADESSSSTIECNNSAFNYPKDHSSYNAELDFSEECNSVKIDSSVPNRPSGWGGIKKASLWYLSIGKVSINYK